MEIYELGRLGCLLYIVLMETLGMVFTFRFTVESKKLALRHKIQIVFAVVILTSLIGPFLFLFIGTYAVALFQTYKQTKSRKQS